MTHILGRPHALTLRNPWAHRIAHHGKDVENRTWPAPAGLTELLIHAGKRWDDVADLPEVFAVVTSAIVVVADVVQVCDASVHAMTVRCRCGRWAAAGQYHWRLGNVVALAVPVPARGRQGLWHPDPGTLEAVRRQLTSAAVR